jgi:hypothetical protein
VLKAAARLHLSTEVASGCVLECSRPELDQPVAGRDVCSIREDVHGLVIGGVDGIERLTCYEKSSSALPVMCAATRRGIDGSRRCVGLEAREQQTRPDQGDWCNPCSCSYSWADFR